MNQNLKKTFLFFVLAGIVGVAFILTDTYTPFWTGFLYGLAAAGVIALVTLGVSCLRKT